MTEGIIEGGWGYVIAAYVLTAITLTAYAWSLFRRWHKARRSEEKNT